PQCGAGVGVRGSGEGKLMRRPERPVVCRGAQAARQLPARCRVLPSADREGDALGKREQKRWVRKALKLLGQRFSGATAFPRGWGTWRDDAQGGRLVWDRPVLIQCFTNEAAVREHTPALREFLLDMGTTTNQGAVACVLDK